MARVIINISENSGFAEILHNLLDGLQGGAPNEYFHLTQEEYENLPSILDIPIKTSQLLNDGEDGINSFITLNDLPSPLGLNGVLNVGNTALDQVIILDSTPNDIDDIFKSEHLPGVSIYTSKGFGSSVTYQGFASAYSLSFTDGAEVAGIVPSLYLSDPGHLDGSVIGNIIAIPPKVNPLSTDNETIATREWINSQGFINNVITSLGYTPANKAGEIFTGLISATNLSGTNTGDNAINSNYASDYRASNFIADTDYLTPNTANSLFDFKPVVYNKTTNLPIFTSPSINNVEGLTLIISGATARTFTDTNLYTRTNRLGIVTSTTGNLAQIRQIGLYINGNTGYEVIYKFGFSDNATDTAIRAFVGLSTNTGIFSNVEPDTLLNCIAVGRLSTSNNLHLIHNDNTGTATTIDLGSNFPANTINTDVYLVKINSAAGSNSIDIQLLRVNTNHLYTTTLTTDIPALSQGLNFGMYIVDTTGANTSTGIDFMGMYIKN